MNTNNRQSRDTKGRSRSSHSSRPSATRSHSGGGGRFRGGSRKGGNNRGGSRSGGHRGGGRGGRKMPTFDPSRFINTNPIEEAPEMYTPQHASFTEFGLNEKLNVNIQELGITSPTPIQDQIIPEILRGRDVIGIAETGTGKTAAFLIPLIEETVANPKRQTLILAPTRELAIQIDNELKKLSKGFKFFSVVCVGGVNIRPQIQDLRYQNHFVIGTPGRVIDLLKRGSFKPEYVTTVVLDEADRMLDMGFINDMKIIISATPETRETLFFSATISGATQKLVHEFLRDPVTVSVKKNDVTNSILQDVAPHGHHNKFETLLGLLKKDEFSRVLIFGSMKHSVERLAQELSAQGVRATSIHGNKNHGQRQRALTQFKEGAARVLVATDVAARGIHVDDVSHVINYDLPNTFEDYVHRIGRTGRGSKRGKALTFILK